MRKDKNKNIQLATVLSDVSFRSELQCPEFIMVIA